MPAHTKHTLLKKYFGHSSFREFQEEAVDALLGGRDVMMIMPTGAGKSLCYQLPSLLMEGVSVVVSPLLALMHDQVNALLSNGIEAAMISSMQTSQEISHTMSQAQNGKLKLLYIAPERFKGEAFMGFLQGLNINFFVVDEAHCVSEWGHEFREDYRQLFRLRAHFPTTPIASFTATATELVRHDIHTQLRLANPVVLQGKLFRPNLTIHAHHRNGNGREQLLAFLEPFGEESGIIYTFTRNESETLANYLATRNIKASAYHAGLATEQKNETYRAFLADEIQIVVATVAFGMGIDKSNIRFVVHMSLPKTIENYYQEIGRAGRDGLEASTLLLFSSGDVVERKRLIESQEVSAYQKVALEKLDKMAKFATSQMCRHQLIAGYFDDTIGACEHRCDNCLEGEKQSVEITEEALKLLSAVYRTGQRFGIVHVIEVLMGAKSEKIELHNHHTLSVYGIGKELEKSQWQSIADRLMELEALKVGEHRVVSLGAYGMQIMKERLKVSIHAKRLVVHTKSAKRRKVEVEGRFDVSSFERLRALRLAIAKLHNLPPYVVFNDKTLKELAEKRPTTKEAMLEISGVGEVKFERYGEAFLELCAQLD